jgi:hypothetical protein
MKSNDWRARRSRSDGSASVSAAPPRSSMRMSSRPSDVRWDRVGSHLSVSAGKCWSRAAGGTPSEGSRRRWWTKTTPSSSIDRVTAPRSSSFSGGASGSATASLTTGTSDTRRPVGRWAPSSMLRLGTVRSSRPIIWLLTCPTGHQTRRDSSIIASVEVPAAIPKGRVVG